MLNYQLNNVVLNFSLKPYVTAMMLIFELHQLPSNKMDISLDPSSILNKLQQSSNRQAQFHVRIKRTSANDLLFKSVMTLDNQPQYRNQLMLISMQKMLLLQQAQAKVESNFGTINLMSIDACPKSNVMS